MDERCGEGELFQLDEIGVGGMDSLTAFLPRPPWSSSASSTMPKQEPGHVVDELEAAEEDQEEEEEEEAALEMPPGFRFKPTDGEVIYYLEEKCANDRFRARAIAEIDINNCEPWDLPNLAKMGEKEWYFFWKRDRKYPTGSRTNRATARGYWKATGKDKEIYRRVDMGSGGGGSSSKGAAPIRCLVGMKKTLVFYLGRAPKGTKSNWVMHEYRRIPHGQNQHLPITPANGKKDWVVCRVFHKTAPDATSAARNNGSETPQTPILQNPIQLPLTIYAHNQNYPYASTRDADMLLTPSLPPLLDDYPSHDSPITGNSSVLPSPAPYGYGATRLAPPPQQVPFYVPIGSNVHSMMPPALSGISIPSSTGGALLRGKCKTELQEYVTALRAAAAPSSHNLVPPRQDPCPGTSGSAGYDGGGPCSPNSSSDGPVAWLENMWDDYSSAGPIDD